VKDTGPKQDENLPARMKRSLKRHARPDKGFSHPLNHICRVCFNDKIPKSCLYDDNSRALIAAINAASFDSLFPTGIEKTLAPHRIDSEEHVPRGTNKQLN